jgi:peptidoglycan/LPS O-acetylase OafA/YrhL
MAVAHRNRTLDGIRGCLAVVVMLNHVLQACGSKALFLPAGIAVWIFFALSACVLTRSWDGKYLQFLGRRFVRLWPMYALGLGVGSLLLGVLPSAQQLFWLHLANADNAPVADPPSWSLAIEAWAMLAMPLIVWVGRASFAWLVIACLGSFVLAMFNSFAIFAWFFFAGAWVSRFDIRLGIFETKVPQWLGRISYPLYLIHVPIIWYMHLPLFVSVPLVFAVAEILARTVEAWSIRASRAIRLKPPRAVVGDGALQSG